jgi:sulfotransferase family protein
VPPERLLLLRLEEDGLGWQQICPYLGVPIPDAPWPMSHNKDEFAKVVEAAMGSSMKRAMAKMMGTAAVVVAGVATGIWYWLN